MKQHAGQLTFAVGFCAGTVQNKNVKSVLLVDIIRRTDQEEETGYVVNHHARQVTFAIGFFAGIVQNQNVKSVTLVK